MSTGNSILLAVILWLFGFASVKVVPLGATDKLAYVPPWMFTLLGKPMHERLPKNVVLVRSIFLQVMGFAIAFYGLCVPNGYAKAVGGILIPMFCGCVVAMWFYKRSPYYLKDS